MILKDQVIVTAGVRSKITGNLYTLESLQKCLEKQKGMKIPGCWQFSDQPGVTQLPFTGNIDLEFIPFYGKLTRIEDNKLIVDIHVTKTSSGQELSAYLESRNNVKVDKLVEFRIGSMVSLSKDMIADLDKITIIKVVLL